MLTTPTHEPLTDDEFERLGSFLEKTGPPGVNCEWVDGYFAALICGPELTLPSECLQEILGDDVVFDSQEQASDIIGLLMRHWNTIAAELQRTIAERHVYLPVLLEDGTGVVRGNHWALGFMRGVQKRPDGWRELLNSDEHGGSVLPMMMLAHEDDPDPDMRPPPIEGDKREQLIAEMIAGLTRIYRHFEPARLLYSRAPAMASGRRRTAKIGRNDPCPCGSGRKYKHCCAQPLH
jgi:uncharacterized protein